MAFKSVPYESLSFNPFTKLGRQWGLVTAGTENGFNTMTVSWGSVGFIWNKPVVTVYIRPQRYTKEFIDQEACFTLSFYSDEQKPALGYLGKVSGHEDKAKVEKSGLTPAFTNGVPYFEEAELVFVCRKMSRTTLAPEGFIDETVDGKFYPEHDYHEMYIAEIVDVLVKE